ncbi:uncharacterized protein [Littorina saxatilis]|uniref:uncharacterized protein isoform X1 n=1 Tax=Littorina saxatilis TaxID=31220 RepID=UPI0038B60045
MSSHAVITEPCVIQKEADSLTAYNRDELSEIHVHGARTVFNRRVFGRTKHHKSTGNDFESQQEVKDRVEAVLGRWANGRSVTLWMSEHLALHLDLPVRTYPQDCWLFQVLCLGEGLKPFILTLFAGASVDREPKVASLKQFSMRCARMLTSSLLNFCHRPFILLPCTLPYDTFTVEALDVELSAQLAYARDFYGGPAALRKSAFDDMAFAVSLIASGTVVPSLLFEQDKPGKVHEWILRTDPDNEHVFHHLIAKLLCKQSGKPLSITYNSRTEAKVKIALLEAAKRLSHCQRICVVTENKDIRVCVERLAAEAKRAYGLDADWFRSCSPWESIPHADAVIAVDVSEFYDPRLIFSLSNECRDTTNKKRGITQ